MDSSGGRGNFLYSFRLGLVSAWKVLVKKGVIKGIKYVFPSFGHLSKERATNGRIGRVIAYTWVL